MIRIIIIIIIIIDVWKKEYWKTLFKSFERNRIKEEEEIK